MAEFSMNPAASAFSGRLPRRMRVVARCGSLSVLVAALFAGLVLSASPAAAVAGFGDVDDGVYYSDPIQWMVDNNIVTDTTEPCFAPYTPATRGETALYMWRMEGQPEAPAHAFEDVTDDEQQPAVAWMSDTEITTGINPTTFGSDQQLTRAQVAAFLHRLAGEPSASGHPFMDVVAGWQQQPVAWMVANKITTGTGPTTFAPDTPVTRAQLATFLYRYQNSPEVTVSPHSPPCGDGFTAVDSAAQHSCGVRTDATIACWGNNYFGQANAPDGSFKAVSAGTSRSCAIRTDNTATCWGSSTYGRLEAPQGQFRAISAGPYHSCAIGTDNTVTCWGNDGNGRTDTPDGQFSSISAGGSHTCAIRTDNTLTCWGNNGDGRTDAPDGQFSSISAGGSHTCAIRTDSTITCWGHNSSGQTIAPSGKFMAISAGTLRSCGVHIDATIECWGNLWVGYPVAPDGQFSTVSAGHEHSCALGTNNTVFCWGRDWAAQTVAPDSESTEITTGDDHSCGIRTNSTIECWGTGNNGQTYAPVGSFTDIAAGTRHSCGIRTDSSIECWGYNGNGQTDAPDGQFTAISARAWHSCGLGTDATIECWGHNGNGQTDAPDGQFNAISAGAEHSCGIRTDFTIECWGHNGNGRTDAPDGEFRTISAGTWHSCGIRTDSTIECWGHNGNGQTDAPDGQFRTISAGASHSCAIQTDTKITCWGRITGQQTGSYIALSAGTRQSCGLRTDSTISCWGEPTISTPSGVVTFISPGQADPAMCRPFGTHGITAGFPLPRNALVAEGTVRVAVLFVDFPNAEASHTTEEEAALGLPYAEEYLEAVSYGKFDIEFVPLHGWLRAEHNHEHYVTALGVGEGIGRPIDSEAGRLADPYLDFTDYESVMVVMPSSHFIGGNGLGNIETEEGPVHHTARINTSALDQPRDADRWGSAAAHELLHNLGLVDLYPYDPPVPESPDAPAGKIWVTAVFGRMGLGADFPADPQDPRLLTIWRDPNGAQSTGYASYLEAAEMLAWSRWQLGWLDSTQISCITETETETTVTLGPVADPGDSIAMAAIPLSGTDVIVIESRPKIGYDAAREDRHTNGFIATVPTLLTEGVLVYTVDAALPSGQLPLVITRDTGNRRVDHYPILTVGESVTIHGYTITVESSTDTTHTVTITKNTE